MNLDARVFFYLDFIAPRIPMTDRYTNQQMVITMLKENNEDFILTLQELVLVTDRRSQPTTKQYVHMLAEWGLQPKFISEYLDIPSSSVSYHLKTRPKTYYNAFLEMKRMHAAMDKQ